MNRSPFAALLAALAAAALPQALVCAKPREVVRIGVASPLSGPQAHYGRDKRNARQ